jgi:protein subunit release factor A
VRQPLLRLTKDDFVVEAYKAPGHGGQHKNKTMSAIRITHPPSGAVASCAEHREQPRNKKEAFKRLCASPKFLNWAYATIAVDEAMKPENLRTEIMVDGEWVAVDENQLR